MEVPLNKLASKPSSALKRVIHLDWELYLNLKIIYEQMNVQSEWIVVKR